MEDIQTLIAITSESLGLLNPSVIEKDLYVTKAIHALAHLYLQVELPLVRDITL